jgi:thymidine phosphorylase
VWHARPGDVVTEGAPLFTLLTDEPERFDRALASLEDGYTVSSGDGAGDAADARRDIVLDRVG